MLNLDYIVQHHVEASLDAPSPVVKRQEAGTMQVMSYDVQWVCD